MKKKHKEILNQLMTACNRLGGSLDGTSTHLSKYRDRQEAHRYCYEIIWGVLSDHPENDYKEDDWQKAEKAIEELKVLVAKQYPDRNGNL